jgi:UDP-GlcNAc:undecaprenyl-phosphate GlcNAc-1-phosphate transferase
MTLTIFFFSFNLFLFLLVEKFSRLYRVYDYPDKKRKFHPFPVSLIGGLFIYLNLLIFFLANYFFSLDQENIYKDKIFLNLLILSAFFLIGYFDDKKAINPNLKLILMFLLIYLTIFFDKQLLLNYLSLSFLDYKFNIIFLQYFLTILCFLLFINALNMIDGINGQAGSYVIFILIIFVINKIFLTLSIILIVATIFILILNFNNKLYLGSTGTLVLGFLISDLFIKSHNIYEVFYADEIFLIMIIPGLDLFRLALTRLLNRKHPFKPDRDHIHHLAIKNFSFINSFLFMQVILIFPYLLFLILKNFIFTIIIVLFTYIFLIYFLKKNEKNEKN